MKLFLIALTGLVMAAPLRANDRNDDQAPILRSEQQLRQRWLATLADDTAAGRKTGTAAQLRMGNWLATEFRELGLQPLPGRVDFFQTFAFTTEKGESLAGRNVLAILPGKQPLDQGEYILLSAHYDHIGSAVDGSTDHVFNGADDNASGVSTLLGIAKQLQQQIARTGQRPNRHIVFAAWDAEEWGLRGSRHFVEQPLLPLSRFVTNLNFEMVGVTEGKHSRNLWMTGWQHSDLFDTLQPLLARQGWSLEADPYPDWKLFLRSDNAPFAAIKNIGSEAAPHWLGIPAHSLSVWRGQSHYHGKQDEVRLIDVVNLTELSMVMADVVTVLANSEQVIAWKENGAERFTRPTESDSATVTGSP